jgi:CRISPR-associated protein Csb2
VSTTIAVRFPLGRYHATPWDRSVNEGATEWPPSPWRVLRALISTWHARWPDLPAAVIDGLLDALGGPPAYRTPAARPGHTRHYLPGLDHKKGEAGGTDLTLDPFLSVPRDGDLLIRWDADLTGEQRAALAKLAELLPYLGRADSVCEARLLEDDPQPDGTWWQPGADGDRHARLLAPARPVSRTALEVTTVGVRRSRHRTPPGTTWVSYGARDATPAAAPGRRQAAPVAAMRFSVFGRAPLKATHGILLADAAHRWAGRRLQDTGVTDERRQAILGTGGAASDHGHAHWIPLAENASRGAVVTSLILWVPGGLMPEEAASIAILRQASGRLGGGEEDGGYSVRGFPEVSLLFQAAGPIEQAAPELCGPARHWQSRAPYLPVRHRKRESLDDYVAADVAAELGYRGRPPARAIRADLAAGLPDRWARDFRRYRQAERLDRARPGLGLRLEFAGEVCGPLLLGQLSHFGYGIFVPGSG